MHDDAGIDFTLYLPTEFRGVAFVIPFREFITRDPPRMRASFTFGRTSLACGFTKRILFVGVRARNLRIKIPIFARSLEPRYADDNER